MSMETNQLCQPQAATEEKYPEEITVKQFEDMWGRPDARFDYIFILGRKDIDPNNPPSPPLIRDGLVLYTQVRTDDGGLTYLKGNRKVSTGVYALVGART